MTRMAARTTQAPLLSQPIRMLSPCSMRLLLRGIGGFVNRTAQPKAIGEAVMQWSNERILTTHTGSLPRPPELTRLYVQRTRGATVDPAEIDRLGKAALQRIVDKQIEAGVD